MICKISSGNNSQKTGIINVVNAVDSCDVQNITKLIHTKFSNVITNNYEAYSVPLRLREKVELKLDRLVWERNLTPVQHSEWASPVVVVPKPNGDIRMCVDCGVTMNKFLKTVHYPLPNIEEIFASLELFLCISFIQCLSETLNI